METMREKLRRIAEHYGLEPQLRQLMEECGELIVASNKYFRNNAIDGLIEEIADVEIMTEQIKMLLDIGKYVDRAKENKIARQLERIKNE